MRMLIIRHGESEADIVDVHEGRADFELTERGYRQAAAMADYVQRNYENISAVYCSTLKRARQTAICLAERLELLPQFDEMLMEFNNGLIAGMDRKTAQEKYPYIPELPVHESVYEQESELEFRFRAEHVLSKIISENPADSTVAVVTHGGMINQLYRAFLRLPVDCDIRFLTGDTGIHEWLINGDQRIILRANLTEHTILI